MPFFRLASASRLVLWYVISLFVTLQPLEIAQFEPRSSRAIHGCPRVSQIVGHLTSLLTTA